MMSGFTIREFGQSNPHFRTAENSVNLLTEIFFREKT